MSCPEGLLAYTYCDFRSSKLQDPVNVAGSLLVQLYSQLQACPENVRHAYFERTHGGQKKRPSLGFLRQCLQDVAEDQKLFLLVDAVDESSTAHRLAEFLARLGGLGREISLLAMSRDDLAIEKHFSRATRIRLETNVEHRKKDIQLYIDHRLASEKLRWLAPSVKIDIAVSLNEKADGMSVLRWSVE